MLVAPRLRILVETGGTHRKSDEGASGLIG